MLQAPAAVTMPLSEMQRFIEKFHDTTVGMWLLPLFLVLCGTTAAFLFTYFLKYLVIRQSRHEKKLAIKNDNNSDKLGLRLWGKYLEKQSEFLLSSLTWLRWFLILACVLYASSLYLGNVIEELKEIPGSKTKSLIVQCVWFSTKIALLSTILTRLFLTFMGAFWGARFLQDSLAVLLERAHRGDKSTRTRLRLGTLNSAGSYLINALLLLVLGLSGAQTLGLDVAPLLATAGVASVAIGFGAQSLVRDLLAGFFILLEDQFAVGDVVSIEGRAAGQVEGINLRITRLRGSDGALYIVPNGEIKWLKNMTSVWSRVDFRISIDARSDVDRALQVLAEEVDGLRSSHLHEDLSGEAETLGIDKIQDNSVTLRVGLKTRPGRQWDVERELNRRILKRLVSEQFQFPQK